MPASVAWLRLMDARWPWPQVWMLACAVVVLVDPWALLQAGFWLSFVAVGVLYASDAGVALPRVSNGLARNLAPRVVAMLRKQWVVTLALAPLSLLLFGQVSLVGLLANAIAIPWVTLVLTPLAMLGVLLPFLWQLAGGAIAFFCLLDGAVAMASCPAVGHADAGDRALVVGRGRRAGRCLAGGAIALVGALPGYAIAAGGAAVAGAAARCWRLGLLGADIGQGNAVLVRTALHALLYDAGPRYSLESDAGHRVLLPLLQSLHTRLDRVVLSHRDTDHVGGAAPVLGMQPQAMLLSSIASDDRLQSLLAAQRCFAGQHWEWDGVQFTVLHPAESDYASARMPNALSLVLRIQSAGPQPRVALLVGDIEAPQEQHLVTSLAALRADLLLVPYHGSKTSSNAAFLDAVQPREAWVQSGYLNRYDHPAAVL
jgi:competence protein ComEC